MAIVDVYFKIKIKPCKKYLDASYMYVHHLKLFYLKLFPVRFTLKIYNKYLNNLIFLGPYIWVIDQVSGQVLFCAFMDRDGVEVHKHPPKKE